MRAFSYSASVSFLMQRPLVIACVSFGLHILWTLVFLYLGDANGHLVSGSGTETIWDDTVWSLDEVRSKLALSGEPIYSYVYNHPFLIYIIRGLYLIAGIQESNFLLLSLVNTFVFTTSILILQRVFQMLDMENPSIALWLYALFPVFTFHVDASSESFRLLLLTLLMYAASRFCKGSYVSLIGFAILVFTLAFFSVFFSLVSILLVSTSVPWIMSERGLAQSREPLRTSLILILAGMFAASLKFMISDHSNYFQLSDWILRYLPEAISRTQQDRVIWTDSFASVATQYRASSGEVTHGYGSIIAGVTYGLAGTIFPSFSQVFFFDKTTWVWWYGFLSIANLIKLIFLILIARHVTKTILIIWAPLVTFMLSVSFVWGPNYDSARYFFSVLPVFMVVFLHFLSFIEKRHLVQTIFIAIAINLLMLVVTYSKRVFIYDDLKISLLALLPAAVLFYVWLLFKMVPLKQSSIEK